MYEHILYEVSDHIGTVTLNRPDRLNSVNTQMVNELVDVFGRTDADDDVRVVIVTGAGRAFCAGADLSGGADVFKQDGDGQNAADSRRDSAGILTLRIFRSLKPVIAAINGAAVGFGASMTLPMDFRVASSGAKLGFPFAARGIVPDGAASWFLPRIVGAPHAIDLCLTARLILADEALALGLVSSVHDPDEVLTAARELAATIATGASPLSTVLTRQLIWTMLGSRHPMEAHRVESAAIRYTSQSAYAREGVASFLDKRAPQWGDGLTEALPHWFPWEHEPDFEDPTAFHP